MVLANLRDIALIEPDALEKLGRKSWNAAMRELGYSDMVERRAPARRIPQPQCAAEGCSKFRKLGDRYCVEHQELETIPF
jgi:hypothetical protein